MPTNLYSIPEDSLSVRYTAPQLSASVNQKLVSAVPHGTYRGFRLATSGSALSVSITPDADHNDHVAVVETLDGYTLSVKFSGSLTLNLSAYASKYVVIALFGEYTVGADTTAEIRAYELSPSDEFTGAAELGELVVLGSVIVPASGLISAGSISPRYRTNAWEATAQDASPWLPLVRDESFMMQEDGASLSTNRYWSINTSTFNQGTWEADAGGGGPIGSKTAIFSWTNLGAYTGGPQQYINAHVTAGQLLKLRLWIKVAVPPSTGSARLRIDYNDTEFTFLATENITVDISSADATWRLVEVATVVSSLVSVEGISRVRFEMNAVTYATSGAKLSLGGLQLFAEQKDFEQSVSTQAPVSTHQATLIDKTVGLGAAEARLSFGSSSPSNRGTLTVGGKPGDIGPHVRASTIDLGSDLLASTGAVETARSTYNFTTGFTYTLCHVYLDDDGNGTFRVYAGDGGGQTTHAIVHNAWWNESTARWQRDIAGGSTMISSGSTGMRIRAVTSSLPWDDGEWSDLGISALSKSQLDVGNIKLGVPYAATPQWPRLHAGYDGTLQSYLLQIEYEDTNSEKSVRIYSGLTAGLNHLVFTWNAHWDEVTSKWIRDAAGNSTMFTFGSARIQLRFYASGGTSPWNDADWANTGAAIDAEDGDIALYDGRLSVTAATAHSNPARTTGLVNTLVAKTMVKAWGKVSLTATTPTPIEGVNFNTASYPGTNLIRIDFQTPMGDLNYAVCPHVEFQTSFQGYLAQAVTPTNTSYFYIVVVDTTTGGAVNPDNLGYVVSYMVLGTQG